MTPVARAIWFIESHHTEDLTLERIATMSYVSKHHLVRAFGTATGYSVMRYVRARRLSMAAVTLAEGAPNILDVAIEAGYNSHEAFTRAFREQFGITPEYVRQQGHYQQIKLLEPIRMSDNQFTQLDKPCLVANQGLTIAGISERYKADNAHIPSQWQRFTPYLGSIHGHIGNATYGLAYDQNDDGHFSYLCGVEVNDTSNLPDGFTHVQLPPQHYLVFFHPDHISAIGQTWNTIWNKSLPESDYVFSNAPTFERYDERFDAIAGTGGVEIWIPIEAS